MKDCYCKYHITKFNHNF